MIACALTGPMPGSASSSSFVAVLIFTAASANAENSSITSSSRNRFIFASLEMVSGRCRDALKLGAGHVPGKQRTHAARDAFVDAEHRGVVPRRAQPRDVGFGEALIFARDIRRKFDVFDCAGAVQLGERKLGLPICCAA